MEVTRSHGAREALEEETFLALVTYQHFKNTKNYQSLTPSFDPSLAPKF